MVENANVLSTLWQAGANYTGHYLQEPTTIWITTSIQKNNLPLAGLIMLERLIDFPVAEPDAEKHCTRPKVRDGVFSVLPHHTFGMKATPSPAVV